MIRGVTAFGFVCLALVMSGCPKEGTAPDGAGASGSPKGAWKAKAFTKVAEGCSQAWSCDCASFPQKAGCKIDGSRDDTTQGLCAADSGPHEACSRCMALPPPVECACKYTCP